MSYETDYASIRLLELLKWTAVKNRTISMQQVEGSWKHSYYSPPGNATPEGLEIYFSQMFSAYEKSASNSSSEKRVMTFSLGGSGSLSHRMTPAVDLVPNPPYDTHRVYLFPSNELKENPKFLDLCADFELDAVGTDGMGYNESDFGYIPYSLVVIDSGSTDDFVTFINMSETTWDNHLNTAIYNAKTNGVYGELLMYHPLILKYEMSLDSRKELILYLMNEEFWELIDIDSFDEGQLVYEIFTHVKEEEGAILFDWLFEGTGWRFKKLHDLMREYSNYFVPWVFIIIREYYAGLIQSGVAAITNTIKNLNINHVIPVGWEKLGKVNGMGAIITQSYVGTKVKYAIKIQEFHGERLQTGGEMAQNVFLDWTHNENTVYDLFETVGVVPTRDVIDKGFIKGKVYPVPAFAVPVIDDLISERGSITDVISMFFDVAAIALPFLKLLTAGVTFWETLGLIYGVASYDITTIKPFIVQSPEGKRFLAAWFWVDMFFNAKDGGEFFYRATEMYKTYGTLVLRDFDDLAFTWDQYVATSDYTNNIGHDDELKALTEELEQFKDDVKEINKTLGRTPSPY